MWEKSFGPGLAGPVPRLVLCLAILGKVNSIPVLAIHLKLRYTYLDDKV